MSIKARILSLFEDSSFRAPVLKLLSGTGIVLVIAYLANIVLLRLYSDEFWGIADYIVSWVSILAPIASLRYEDALMLPENRRQSAHTYLLSIVAVMATTVIMLAILSFSDTAIVFFEEKEVGRWALILPLALFGNRLAKISELWLARQESFGRISAAQVVQTSSMVSVRIAAGVVGPGPGGLLWGYVVGFGLSAVFISKRIVTTLRQSFEGRPTFKEFRYVASRYRKFPLFTTPAALLSALVTRLPILLIPEFFDWSTAGQFSRGFNLLFLPLSLIAMAVAQVFFVRAVEAHRAGTLSVLSANVHSRLVLLALFPTGIVMVAGPDIFEVLFGEDWRPSAEYLRYVAPWIMFSIVASPMTRLFDVLERQRLELVVASLMFITILGAILLGARIGGIEALLLYLGIAGAFVRFGQIVLLLRLTGAKLGAVLIPYWTYFLPALPALAAAAYVTRFDNPLMTLITAVIGGAGFALYVLRSEKLI